MSAQYRRELLAEAAEIVAQDRNTSYGEPEDNFGTIARYWAVLFGIPVTPVQVAEAMMLLKLARASTGDPTRRDHWVDIAGYAACAGDIADPESLRNDAQARLFDDREVAKL